MKALWTNGKILSLKNDEQYDWMTTDNGLISDLGFNDNKPDSKEFESTLDLENGTLMTSFIDAHSHFSANVYNFIQADLTECKNFEDIKNVIKIYIEQNKVEKDDWITATGYDHNNLDEKDHPRKDFLDSISKTNPIVIHHKSGHVGVFNSAALDYLGVDEETKTPEGGLIEKDEDGLTGYMEENAFMQNIKASPMPGMDDIESSIKKAEQRYLSYGITTVQEGMMVKELIPLYDAIINKVDLNIDIVYYTGLEDRKKVLDKFPKTSNDYNNNVRFGGIKMFLDGSPQGKTAWLREPYEGEENYKGYGTMSDEEVYEGLKLAYLKKVQPLAHCNGDAAIQQYIDAVRMLKNEGKDLSPLKPVVIHAQLLGQDQVKEVAELGMIPSFFLAHVFHWGDVHIENLGVERASLISPAKSALECEIPFTLHQDSPVIPPNMIETLSCAVNRKTRKGVTLGESEKITIEEALKAITENSAYQYSELETKGTLEIGKKADFVVLSKNPLTISNDDINNIEVLNTIKNGIVVYSKR